MIDGSTRLDDPGPEAGCASPERLGAYPRSGQPDDEFVKLKGHIVAIFSFQMPKATTPEDMSGPFEAAVPLFQKVLGLLQKYFYVSDDGRRAGGVYVWASRADADRLYGGKWRAMVEAKFGGPPTIDFLDAPVVIDNRHGTVTAP